MKRFTKTNRYRSIGQQPGTKSGHRPADKPRVNRSLCSSIGLHKNPFVRASKDTFRTIGGDALEVQEGKGNGCVQGHRTLRCFVLPGPLRPSPRRGPTRLDPSVVCPGFGIHM